MLHTIHADFYRLFRSKGFWISEIILALNIISGVLLGGTGHVGVETGAKQAVQSASSWTGVGSLINYSSSISMTVLFTLIVVSIILGVDLAQKLYKNNLTSGISRSGFFFAKTTVIVAINSSCLTVLPSSLVHFAMVSELYLITLLETLP